MKIQNWIVEYSPNNGESWPWHGGTFGTREKAKEAAARVDVVIHKGRWVKVTTRVTEIK